MFLEIFPADLLMIPNLFMISAVVQVADKSQDDYIYPDRTSVYHYDFGDGCMKQLPQPPTSHMENRAVGTFIVARWL